MQAIMVTLIFIILFLSFFKNGYRSSSDTSFYTGIGYPSLNISPPFSGLIFKKTRKKICPSADLKAV